jgi:hypothetical protein
MLRSLLISHRISAFNIFPRLHGIIAGYESLYNMQGKETFLCAARNMELHWLYVVRGSVINSRIPESPATPAMLMAQELHELTSHCTDVHDLMIATPHTRDASLPPNAAWWSRFTNALLTTSVNHRRIKLTGTFADTDIFRLAVCEGLEELVLVRQHGESDPVSKLSITADRHEFSRLRHLEVSDWSQTAGLAINLLLLIRPKSVLEFCKVTINKPVDTKLFQQVTMTVSDHVSLTQLDIQIVINVSTMPSRRTDPEETMRLIAPLFKLQALRTLNIRMDCVALTIPTELVSSGTQAWPALVSWTSHTENLRRGSYRMRHPTLFSGQCRLSLAAFVDVLRTRPHVRVLPVTISCEDMRTIDLAGFTHQYGPRLYVDQGHDDGNETTSKALNILFPRAKVLYT